MSNYEKYLESANYIKSKFDASGAIGLVLGSGLGNLASEIVDPIVIPYKDIPHFPIATAPGHEGSLYCGYIDNVKVVCMKGRFHFYEGHTMQTITMPIRVMKLLGIEKLFLTNAAGGVNLDYTEGTLMVLDDWINYQGDNPLVGANEDEFGVRFPDMTTALTKDYRDIAMHIGQELGINIHHGVYMSFRGPSFETPAEIKFARTCGADAVGMSTVPEIIVARHCGMKILAISCITNMAAGITGRELTLEEVEEVTVRINGQFRELIKRVIKEM